MPTARRLSKPRKSKARKRCSKSRTAKSCRSKKSCAYSSSRSPKCQPKKSRRRSSRKSPRTSAVGTSSLLTKAQIEESEKKRRCLDNASTDPFKCPDDCMFDFKTGGMCVPMMEPLAKLLSGKKMLTFRHSKSPSVSVNMPINYATLLGDYAGAIRFSPITGKLHLCYGPLWREPKNTDSSDDKYYNASTRAALAMILKDDHARALAKWYTHVGFHLEQRRTAMLHEDDHYYAELFMLPGASLQLSYQEIVALDAYLKKMSKDEFSLSSLADPPYKCPPILGEGNPKDECFVKQTSDSSNRMGWFAPMDSSPPTYKAMSVPIMVTAPLFTVPFSKPTKKPTLSGVTTNNMARFEKPEGVSERVMKQLISSVDRAERAYDDSGSDSD